MLPADDRTALAGIYQIRCLLNHKIYIGCAAVFRERWRIHRRDLAKGDHHSVHLQRAWDKHGHDAFAFEILEIVDDPGDKDALKAILISREQDWLDRTRSFVKRIGYNISPTAGSQLGVKRSDETRARQSESKRRFFAANPEARERVAALRRGTTLSEEHRSAISTALVGHEVSHEVREKISATQKGRPVSDEKRVRLSEIMKNKGCYYNPAPDQAALDFPEID